MVPLRHRSAPQKEHTLRAFLRGVAILPFDERASEEAAGMMGALLKIGKPTKVLDVMIAGIASSVGAKLLVTKDREFERIGAVSDLNIQII